MQKILLTYVLIVCRVTSQTVEASYDIIVVRLCLFGLGYSSYRIFMHPICKTGEIIYYKDCLSSHLASAAHAKKTSRLVGIRKLCSSDPNDCNRKLYNLIRCGTLCSNETALLQLIHVRTAE